MSSEKFELLYAYSRKNALEDGVLVDVSEWASVKTGFSGGFKVPVALTDALFRVIENFPPESGEDIRGRAHDVLHMAAITARAKGNDDSRRAFKVTMTSPLGVVQTLELLVDIGPGDDGAPVVTIGFPEDF